MSMSKIRKNIQAKLRKKFKWSTKTNRNCDVMFEKMDANPYYVKRPDLKKTVDIMIYCSNEFRNNDMIEINLAKYGISNPDNPLIESVVDAYVSFDELELLYNAIKQYRDEIAKEETNNGTC